MIHYEWGVKRKIEDFKRNRVLIHLQPGAWMRSVTFSDEHLVKYFMRWRKASAEWFPTQFNVTYFGTKKWYRKLLMEKEDRVLFLIESESGPIGHLGLNRFDFKNRTCEIDNVVRGDDAYPGIMTKALEELVKIAFEEFEVRNLYLETFKNNKKAIDLYRRCGFVGIKSIPLSKVEKNGEIHWVETDSVPERFNLRMQWTKKQSQD